MPTNLVPITVRLDEDLYDDIVDLAKREGRSINKQMVLLMQIGYEYFKPVMPAKRGRPKKEKN